LSSSESFLGASIRSCASMDVALSTALRAISSNPLPKKKPSFSPFSPSLPATAATDQNRQTANPSGGRPDLAAAKAIDEILTRAARPNHGDSKKGRAFIPKITTKFRSEKNIRPIRLTIQQGHYCWKEIRRGTQTA
jgi:hypothetical protein